MSRPPWVLGGKDPLQDRRALAGALEDLAGRARRTHTKGVAGTRPPLLLLAAGAMDTLSADAGADLVADPDLMAAAGRAGIDVAARSVAEGEQLRGFVSAVRGAAGEQWVADRLINGELPVPDGTVTAMLHDFGLPGVDITLRDGAGDVLGAANVKIAGTSAVVAEHIERYADAVPVVYATSDAVPIHIGVPVVGPAGFIGDGLEPVVVDIGVPSTHFSDEVTAALAADIAEATILDDLPCLSAGMVGIRAVRRLQTGASLAEVSRGMGEDTVRSGAAFIGGNVVGSLGAAGAGTAGAAVVAGWAAHGAMEVRRSWRDARLADTRLADMADQILWSARNVRHRGAG